MEPTRHIATCTYCGTARILVNPTGEQLGFYLADHAHPAGVVTVRLIRRLPVAA